MENEMSRMKKEKTDMELEMKKIHETNVQNVQNLKQAEDRAEVEKKRADGLLAAVSGGSKDGGSAAAMDDLRKQQAEQSNALQLQVESMKKEVATEKKKRAQAEKNAAMNAAVVASTPRGGVENASASNSRPGMPSVSKVAKKVHREQRQERDRQTKKKLGSKCKWLTLFRNRLC